MQMVGSFEDKTWSPLPCDFSGKGATRGFILNGRESSSEATMINQQQQHKMKRHVTNSLRTYATQKKLQL